jgi:hypothetical protein
MTEIGKFYTLYQHRSDEKFNRQLTRLILSLDAATKSYYGGDRQNFYAFQKLNLPESDLVNNLRHSSYTRKVNAADGAT